MISDDSLIDHLQRAAFDYFLLRANPANGLIPDTSRPGSPASIAVVGFALSSYPVAVERGWITRDEAIKRTLVTMRFFCNGPDGATFSTIGHRGFCYHFLEMQSGKRAWDCELSFIDTALLVAGMLTAASYFSKRNKDESEIRTLVDTFYRRIEWAWALNGGDTLALAWQRGKGFMKERWQGYNEGLILYILGLASPTHPLLPDDYKAWTASYEWREFYNIECLYGAPLFVHHFSHAWIDFRGLRDDFMRGKNCDYFENSVRMTLIQQKYAIENPRAFKGYSQNCWGLSAGDGPVNKTVTVQGKKWKTQGYAARGVPYGPDDGTLMPSAVIASLPFTPDLALQAVRHMQTDYPEIIKNYHVPSGFNPSLPDKQNNIWVSDGYYGLDQGIMIMMIENYRSEFLWSLMKSNSIFQKGLNKAGFQAYY